MTKTKWLLLVTLIFLFLITIINSTKNNTQFTSIELQTGPSPWPAEINQLRARLNYINLPALSEEGNTLHTHQHLDIYIDGNHLTIPTDIGINKLQRFISPIHTHDTTGIIHVESPTIQTFTLGQFFDIWGVRFNDNCIGGYCSNNGKKLSLYNNGQLVQNNYKELALEPHQQIAVVFGSPPSSIPSTYNFPPDY